MVQLKKKYIVIDLETNQYLYVGTIFYKTKNILEATRFKTKEQAIQKIMKEGIHYIVKYQVIKITNAELKEVDQNGQKKCYNKMVKGNAW